MSLAFRVQGKSKSCLKAGPARAAHRAAHWGIRSGASTLAAGEVVQGAFGVWEFEGLGGFRRAVGS